MAGERFAKIVIRASWSLNANRRADQTEQVRFYLGGQWETYRRGASASEFVVPDPTTANGAYTKDYMMDGVKNLITLLRATIAQRALPVVVSDVRYVGDIVGTDDGGILRPQVEFDITSLVLDQSQFKFEPLRDPYTPKGWLIVSNLQGLVAIEATSTVVDATIFGSATGQVAWQVTVGNGMPYRYVWADDPAASGFARQNLPAATYRLTITDGQGVSGVFTAVVKSDPRLEVQVVPTDTSITLVPSGGVPPYTFAWLDGPTTAVRLNLAPGRYECLVTDAHGATREVVVTLSAYQYYWSQNSIPLALDAGNAYRLDPSTKPNLSFLCQVWVEPVYLSNDFVQVGVALEQPADAQGRTTFEVQALLAAYLRAHVPAVGAREEERADPLFRRFFLQHAEQFGTPPVAQPGVALERNYVVLGGLSFYEAAARTWFTRYQPEVKPFLTWEPPTKHVLADQPEYLYYMVTGAPGSFRYQVRVGFSDGTERTDEHGSQDQVRDFEVYCLPVGYQALDLASLVAGTDKQVRWWEVLVTKPGRTGVLSETRRFVLDRRPFPKRRYLLFATSLGGMATYAALGEAQLELEVKGEEAGLSLPAGYDPQLGDVAVESRTLRPVVKLAGGKRTAAQLRASQDLLLSRRVLLLAGARWLPGFLKAKTVTLLDENKRVQTQELEFTLATERLYTPDL